MTQLPFGLSRDELRLERDTKVVQTPKAPQPREVRVNPPDGQNYVWIPPGSFEMGCSPGDNQCRDDEKPPRRVTLTKGFWMGQTEVTVGAYKRFAQATGRKLPSAPSFNRDWQDGDLPIVNVTWQDATAFCQWGGRPAAHRGGMGTGCPGSGRGAWPTRRRGVVR